MNDETEPADEGQIMVPGVGSRSKWRIPRRSGEDVPVLAASELRGDASAWGDSCVEVEL
ncbi:hypothetical protein ACFW9U_19655 [Rhodococcus aetherivorans]|uniref:hypothetical protein n=1 Tax=Rhodococcus aetherivorans TaxID=191292 RepID=UPI0036710C59